MEAHFAVFINLSLTQDLPSLFYILPFHILIKTIHDSLEFTSKARCVLHADFSKPWDMAPNSMLFSSLMILLILRPLEPICQGLLYRRRYNGIFHNGTVDWRERF
ncbi:uncharacterized protein P174DRAFT_60757 [Aspergillus novofumigatus IBT 16806]|uniref:Uncharacterized protein n=1 Tax=Aspergillus novofumigatus (strain IBT 16806) TaxID=1392255 RepID=A0A2I1BUB1_ASPN1|nr:uncharacterized protein P174DRAFT_60757 [Aspergillus novofumigatus IBT 16806]PKX88956.1 hypothetical protein P174DRAFT_60757 [Aspergillus novofumigatus IBT 16806]